MYKGTPRAHATVSDELSQIARLLGAEFDKHMRASFTDGPSDIALALHRAMRELSNDELERVETTLVLLSFGQDSVDVLDTAESLFNRVASDLGLSIRHWWTPDAEFLDLLRKDQLENVAIESGASLQMGKLKSYGKRELVDALAQYFARTANPAVDLDEHDQKGREWVPEAMTFPARRQDPGVQ